MQTKYIKAVNVIQDIFHDLANENKVNDYQVQQFNEAQKVLVSFNQWVCNQISGNQKIELPWQSEAFEAKWLEWKKHHKQKTGKNYTPIGEQKALSKLHNMTDGQEKKAIENIDYSMENNWSGVYPKKDEYRILNKRQKPGQILQDSPVKDFGNDWS